MIFDVIARIVVALFILAWVYAAYLAILDWFHGDRDYRDVEHRSNAMRVLAQMHRESAPPPMMVDREIMR